jgi:hypothetical protein
MHATTVEIDSGHLSLVTHPEEVTQLIVNAVQAVRQSAGPRAADGLLPGRQVGGHVVGGHDDPARQEQQ